MVIHAKCGSGYFCYKKELFIVAAVFSRSKRRCMPCKSPDDEGLALLLLVIVVKHVCVALRLSLKEEVELGAGKNFPISTLDIVAVS